MYLGFVLFCSYGSIYIMDDHEESMRMMDSRIEAIANALMALLQ